MGAVLEMSKGPMFQEPPAPKKQEVDEVSDLSARKSRWQSKEPALMGDSSMNRALWGLSLVLREIAKSPLGDTEKQELPPGSRPRCSEGSGEERNPHEQA